MGSKALVWIVIILIIIGGGYWYYTTQMGASAPESVKPDATLVVSDNMQGTWQSADDAKYRREFSGEAVTDWYDNEAVSTGTFVVFTKDNMKGVSVPFPVEDNAVYAQLTTQGTEADKLNFKILMSADANSLQMIYMDRGGVLNFTRVPETMGTYPYECDERVMFSMTPSGDVSTVVIAPLTGSFPATTTLTKAAATSGVKYEGGGYIFTGKGEGVTLTNKGATLNCSPVPNPDSPPFNWGD